MQYIKMEDTVFFFFGVNDSTGEGANGTTPLVTVRDTNDVIGAVPMPLADTPATVQLLSGVGFPDGCHEIAVAATTANLFAPDRTYAVFATIAISGVNPTGHIGIFRTQPVPAQVRTMDADVIAVGVIQDAAISAAKFAAGAINAAAIATDAIDNSAIANGAITNQKFATGAIDSAVFAAGAINAAAINADAEIDLRMTGLNNINIDGLSMPLATEIIAAAVAGKLNGAGSGTETFRSIDDTTDRMISTVDASGNRINVTYP